MNIIYFNSYGFQCFAPLWCSQCSTFSVHCSVLYMKNECYRRYGSVFCSVLFEEWRWHGNYIFIPFKITTTTAFPSDADMYVCWQKLSLHPINNVSSCTPAYYKFTHLYKSGIIRNEKRKPFRHSMNNRENLFRISYVPICVCMRF